MPCTTRGTRNHIASLWSHSCFERAKGDSWRQAGGGDVAPPGLEQLVAALWKSIGDNLFSSELRSKSGSRQARNLKPSGPGRPRPAAMAQEPIDTGEQSRCMGPGMPPRPSPCVAMIAASRASSPALTAAPDLGPWLPPPPLAAAAPTDRLAAPRPRPHACAFSVEGRRLWRL